MQCSLRMFTEVGLYQRYKPPTEDTAVTLLKGSPPVHERPQTLKSRAGRDFRADHPEPLTTHLGNQRLAGLWFAPTYTAHQNKRGLEVSSPGFQGGALSMLFYSLLHFDY